MQFLKISDVRLTRLFAIAGLLSFASATGTTILAQQQQQQTPVDPPGIRVVACDAKVPSKKRGICANKLSAEDFRAFAPAVTWYYNWHYKTDHVPPSDVKM